LFDISVFVHNTIIGQKQIFAKVYFDYSRLDERLQYYKL